MSFMVIQNRTCFLSYSLLSYGKLFYGKCGFAEKDGVVFS